MVLAQVAILFIVTLLLGAHFLRMEEAGAGLASVSTLLLLFFKRRWVPIVLRTGLFGAMIIWGSTTLELVRIRLILDEPWLRLTLILGTVTAVTGLSTLLFRTKAMRDRFKGGEGSSARASAAAFMVTALLLSIVQVVVERRMLLADRFWSGGGWLAVVAFATYAAWLTEKLLDSSLQPLWRRRLWGLFAIVFFAQLALGLLGIEQMLMTGTLHLPIPAVILAGPIFRGGGFFMIILFSIALLLVGPAWCSYLCYFGAIDSALAHSKRRPRRLPIWAWKARVAILGLVVLTAALLRILGASGTMAAGVGLAFGVVGVLLSIAVSRRQGAMIHCTVYCPIGLIADVLGKISPFRVRIGAECTECGLCTKACRFDALHMANIKRRRPGLTCTLCGDCVGACHDGQLGYRFAGLESHRARALFVMIVAALHAVFLAVARI